MKCDCENRGPRLADHNFPASVVEIKNAEQLILFRKVVIPASLGNRETIEPTPGMYKNVLLEYEEDGSLFLFSSDGIPTELASDVSDFVRRLNVVAAGLESEIAARTQGDSALSARISAEELARIAADNSLTSAVNAEASARADADTALGTRIDTVSGVASTAVQPGDINYTLVSDFDVDSDPSTTFLKLNAGKVNISTGATSTKNVSLPVASSEQAGIMNSATFNAVAENSEAIEALKNGAVAVNGLPASPTQAQVTAAWRAETGQTTLINRASVYDVTNQKVWTYYTNDATWYAVSNTTQVTVNTFTNSSEGVIKGSTVGGQVFAESDGTGSVNGWDALTAQVAANTANIPTVYDATLTIQNNGTNVATFTANSSTNTTANIVPPVQIGSVLSTPSSVAYVDTANIIDGAVTTNKFAQNAVNNGIKTANNITPAADTPAAWAAALGGDGLYITAYTTASLFTDQHNLGTAETIVIGNEVVQRWYEESGVIWWRHGSGDTWSTTSPVTGDSFLVIEDSTTTHVGGGLVIPNNADLNTAAYAMTGAYTGHGASMTNCPTETTFRLEVHEVGRKLRVTQTTANMWLIRVLSDYDGSIFVQRVWSDSQAQWHFDAWRTIAGGNDGLHPYSWAFIPSSNYTVDFGHIYLKSDILLLNIGVHKNSGTIGADEVIGQLSNWAAPAHEVLAASFLSNTSNFVSQAIGYLYIDGKDSYTPANIGKVIISDSAASHTHAKIYIWIPIK